MVFFLHTMPCLDTHLLLRKLAMKEVSEDYELSIA